eukprot:s6899_g2.t1
MAVSTSKVMTRRWWAVWLAAALILLASDGLRSFVNSGLQDRSSRASSSSRQIASRATKAAAPDALATEAGQIQVPRKKRPEAGGYQVLRSLRSLGLMAGVTIDELSPEQKGELACTYAALILHDDGADITPASMSTLIKVKSSCASPTMGGSRLQRGGLLADDYVEDGQQRRHGGPDQARQRRRRRRRRRLRRKRRKKRWTSICSDEVTSGAALRRFGDKQNSCIEESQQRCRK